MRTILISLLLALVACDRGADSADTASADLGGVHVVSARCEDLYREGSYAYDVIGMVNGDLDGATVLLTSGALWHYGSPDDVSTMGKQPDADGNVQLAYLGECPDNFRVFIMLP